MSEAMLGLLGLLLSIGATYFFCIRPMRKGSCVMAHLSCHSGSDCADETDLGAAARLRAEITALDRQVSHSASE